MYARVATFESDPAQVDNAIEMVRSQVESGETPAGLEGADAHARQPGDRQRPWSHPSLRARRRCAAAMRP